MLFIPGVQFLHDTEEHNIISKENKEYEELKENKKGSDLYTERGT